MSTTSCVRIPGPSSLRCRIECTGWAMVSAFYCHTLTQSIIDHKIVIKTGVKLVTKEGKAAIREAIGFLEKQEPIEGDMKICKALCRSAQMHADDTGPKGITGHFGSDGSEMHERIEKFVEYTEWMGENCNYSQFTKARDVVIDLLIDDGISDRSHRRNLFIPDFTCLGIGVADHSKFGKAVVINYASDVTPINPEDGYITFPDDPDYNEVEFESAGVTHHGNATPGMKLEAMKERHRRQDKLSNSWFFRTFL